MTTSEFEILIVDDSPIIRKFIRRAVGLAGFDNGRVHEAENGQVALDCVSSQQIDIVFLDLNMPVMDGETFLRHIRAKDNLADLPVIVVSTECNAERLAELSKLGVLDVLHKPFKPEKLRELVESIDGERG